MRAIALLLLSLTTAYAVLNPEEKERNAPQAPFRLADGLYYVGTADIASFLITTPKGHILINTGFEGSVPLILKDIETLGLKPTEIRFLLNSQGHHDHVGGTKAIQLKSGAKVISSVADALYLREGKFPVIDRSWPPVVLDREVRDGDKVELGGVTLIARMTPGNTPGCTTWIFTAKDGAKPLRTVIVGGFTVVTKLNGSKLFPTIVDDYRQTFRILESLPCDLFLAAHPGQFQMAENLRSKSPDRFVDPEGYRRTIAQAKAEFKRRLARGA